MTFPDLAGVTHRFVTVDGVKLHVAEAGAGETVLLLHSFPEHWYAWRAVIPLLAREYRVICPDFRGAGWSDAPRTGYDTDTRVADLLGLLDALGLDTVRLVSHGWGAWTAFRLCLTAPERVREHLAVNMIHPWPAHRRLVAQAWRFWYTACWEVPFLGRRVLRRWPALTRFLLRHWAGGPDVLPGSTVAEYARRNREPAIARAGEAMNWQFVVRDIPRLALGRDRTARIAVPTRILLGGRDRVIRPGSVPATDHFTDLTVVVAPDCGHLIPEQRPDLIAANLSQHRPAQPIPLST
jgi:pimeloyl-ACP methyl ester carboxylesterase